MKKQHPYWKISAGLAVAALTLLTSASVIQAATALNGSLTQRPLTPTEIKAYGLTGSNAQFSAGCRTVAIGEPVFLDAMVNAAIAPSNIVGVTWSLVPSNMPVGSLATLSAGPLGTNVPLYNTSDRYTGETQSPAYQLAGRTYFRPDAVGTYTVNATITTVGSGTTNLSATITAATYVGVSTCAGCHSGGVVFNGHVVPNIYSTFTNTPHASFFTRAVDGQVSDHYSKNCISCHVLGYDTNSFANNGGFDDVALLYNWIFPTVLTNNPSNWAAMPSALKNVANIQCENCHGPGTQHIYSQGVVGNTNAISVNYAAGDCAQCHDSLNTHFKNAEWNISLHSAASRTPSGASRPQCVRCHTAPGFVGWATAGGMDMLNKYPTNIFWANSSSTNIVAYTGVGPNYTTGNPPNTTYYPITCQACHDPHSDANPSQLRFGTTVALSDGTVVTNAGRGALCMQCHNNRDGSYTNMMAKYPLSQATWAGGSAFGTHDSPQADILEGVNAETYGKVIPNAAHANVVPDTCAGCHMQAVASTNAAFLKAGGHTFKMSYLVTNNSVVTEVPLTTICQQCHGDKANSTFDFPVADYNGDGVIEGVQTEVHHLLDKLSTLLPPKVYKANPNDYVGDGVVKTTDSLMATYTNVPAKFLKAYYNFDIVLRDNSFGIHNAPFVVGLLKASIGDLTGDSNNDGLPDAWQIANFGAGFATNAAAAYTAVNASGYPNWLMASLGLSPFNAPVWGSTGGVLFNGNNIINGATNTIAIYSAAEIAFNTQVGTTYQIQGISALNGSWSNVSTNIPGTGGTISYLTPMRNNAQMFYRVIHTP